MRANTYTDWNTDNCSNRDANGYVVCANADFHTTAHAIRHTGCGGLSNRWCLAEPALHAWKDRPACDTG